MAVFETQSLIDLILNTGIDISAATVLAIHYQKPSGIDGLFSGTLEGTQKIKYQAQVGDFDEIGTWQFQSVVTLGGRVGLGGIVKIVFNAKLTDL